MCALQIFIIIIIIIIINDNNGKRVDTMDNILHLYCANSIYNMLKCTLNDTYIL